MIAATGNASRDRRPQAGSTRRTSMPVQPAGVETRAPLLLVAKSQPLDLVAAKRDDQRAFVAIIDRGLASASSSVRKSSHSRWLSSASARQILATRLMLGSRGEHAGRREARTASGFGAVEHRDRQAATRQPPGDRQADHARADHRDVGSRGKRRPSAPASGTPPVASAVHRVQSCCPRKRSSSSPSLSGGEIGVSMTGRALEIQSLRRYEPDQVRRISALTCGDAAAQRFLSPLSGISLECSECGALTCRRQPAAMPPSA